MQNYDIINYLSILYNYRTLFTFFSLSATVTICCMFLPKLSIILLHPEKNVRQSMMMASKHNNNFSTKGTPTMNNCNVGIVSNATKLVASSVAAPGANLLPQQNGPSNLASKTKDAGKRPSVVIVTNKDHMENGNKIFKQ